MTEEPETAESIARLYAEGMIKNYTEDGHLIALLAIHHTDGEYICALSEMAVQDVQQSYLLLLSAIGGLLDEDPTFVVTVMEAWAKRESLPEGTDWDEAIANEAISSYPRGRLSEMAEAGDTTVYTSLVVTVYDVADLRQSFGLALDADHDMEPMESPGKQYGGVADHIEMALGVLPELRKRRPPEMTLARVMQSVAPFVLTLVDQRREAA